MMKEPTSIGGWIAGVLLYEDPVRIAPDASIWSPVRIGAHSYVNGQSVVRAHSTIGRFCSIGYMVWIGAEAHDMSGLTTASDYGFARDPDFQNPYPTGHGARRETVVGHDVWIGAGAVVVQGVEIGTGSVIGANAVVTRDVAPYTVVGGVPARPIRRRFPDALCAALLDSQWWTLPDEVLTQLPYNNPEKSACIASKYVGPINVFGENFTEYVKP